jgi:hypothetical protein
MVEPIDPTEPASAVATAPVGRRFTDLEAARAIAYFLLRAGEKVGVDPDDGGWDSFVRRILTAAQGGRLPVDEYRLVWQLAAALR